MPPFTYNVYRGEPPVFSHRQVFFRARGHLIAGWHQSWTIRKNATGHAATVYLLLRRAQYGTLTGASGIPVTGEL